MRCDFLVEAVGNIDPSLVDEAENYRPKRKSRAWIWAAASAACVAGFVWVLTLFGAFDGTGISHTDENTVTGWFAGTAEHGYVDYRELAEKGKVTITDELKALMEEDSTAFDMLEKHPGNEFCVRITDAGGADVNKIYAECLRPLGLSADETERFLSGGAIFLTKKQIYSIEGSPELALIIAPAALVINGEYTKTAGRDTLDVWVFTNDGLDDLRRDCTDEEQWKLIEERTAEFFGEYAEDYGIEADEFMERTGTFHAVLDTELVARMLADERTYQIWVVTE